MCSLLVNIRFHREFFYRCLAFTDTIDEAWGTLKIDNIVFDPWGDIRYELSSSSSLQYEVAFVAKELRDHTVLCTEH